MELQVEHKSPPVSQRLSVAGSRFQFQTSSPLVHSGVGSTAKRFGHRAEAVSSSRQAGRGMRDRAAKE